MGAYTAGGRCTEVHTNAAAGGSTSSPRRLGSGLQLGSTRDEEVYVPGVKRHACYSCCRCCGTASAKIAPSATATATAAAAAAAAAAVRWRACVQARPARHAAQVTQVRGRVLPQRAGKVCRKGSCRLWCAQDGAVQGGVRVRGMALQPAGAQAAGAQ